MKLSFAYIQRPVLVYVLKMASLEIHTANQQRRKLKCAIGLLRFMMPIFLTFNAQPDDYSLC